MREKYDLIVIGGGSGGLVCAAGAAALGAKVALIEKKKLGGDCLNTGCVPSKALIRSAKVIHTLRSAEQFGIRECQFEFDFSDIMRRVKNVQGTIEPHDSPERFKGLGVDVKFGNYSFKSAHELTNGEDTLFGKRMVIATGSSPVVPPIPGCEEAKCLTSENIWDIQSLPKRFVVIGGGPIGSELAHAFSRFGSYVTLIDFAPGILMREDPDLRAVIESQFQKEGIQCRFSAKVQRILHAAARHIVSIETSGREENFECDAIFLAVGRKANTGGLGLEKVGIMMNERGIIINDYGQTSLKHIYACGDVAGSYQFTHFADYQARRVLRNALFPGRARVVTDVVPWCTFTDPELARVGLSETEAKQRKIAHDVYKYEISELDRAVCEGEATGFVKVITKKSSDKILGAAIVGPHAGDLIQELVLALQKGIGLKTLASTIHPYPTMAEVSKKVSEVWMRSLLKPWMTKILKFYFQLLFR